MIKKTKSTKAVNIGLVKGNPAKQAGSNRLTITVNSSDWRNEGQTIRMTLRDAQSLRAFLNENLD